MRKNIWIFHHYATPPTMSGLTRPYEFGIRLKEKGYSCIVFLSAYLHYTGENLISNGRKYIVNNDTEIPFIFIRTSEYKGNGLSRVSNMISFANNLLAITKEIIKKQGNPDIFMLHLPIY